MITILRRSSAVVVLLFQKAQLRLGKHVFLMFLVPWCALLDTRSIGLGARHRHWISFTWALLCCSIAFPALSWDSRSAGRPIARRCQNSSRQMSSHWKGLESDGCSADKSDKNRVWLHWCFLVTNQCWQVNTGSSVFVLDWVHAGPVLLVRSSVRMGSASSMLDFMHVEQLGSIASTKKGGSNNAQSSSIIQVRLETHSISLFYLHQGGLRCTTHPTFQVDFGYSRYVWKVCSPTSLTLYFSLVVDSHILRAPPLTTDIHLSIATSQCSSYFHVLIAQSEIPSGIPFQTYNVYVYICVCDVCILYLYVHAQENMINSRSHVNVHTTPCYHIPFHSHHYLTTMIIILTIMLIILTIMVIILTIMIIILTIMVIILTIMIIIPTIMVRILTIMITIMITINNYFKLSSESPYLWGSHHWSDPWLAWVPPPCPWTLRIRPWVLQWGSAVACYKGFTKNEALLGWCVHKEYMIYDVWWVSCM